ncbi:DUF2637 domain-containing protein [Actinoplanes sp. NPDC049681]|uniref:DUF2637 domain-containing protein n=1 Tax=Actinoplanes sp. NPDC049681 TaxID=3363905 RepID=UPI0037B16C90
MILPQLRRVRWAVRATLVLGVAASVVANVLHALDNPISQAIAAWPPLALLLTVELISRVPVHRRSLAFARLVATATIAGIAAWVSYWHMAGVAARYGETGASPYLLPLSVDGLIVVASICLVELGGRISALERETKQAADVPGLIPVPTAAQPSPVAPAPRRSTAEALAEVAAALPKNSPARTRDAEVSSFTPTVTRRPRPVAAAKSGPARTATTATVGPTTSATARPATSASTRPATSARPAGSGPAKSSGSTKPAAKSSTAPRVRRTPAETIAAAEKIRTIRPDVTDTELAAELGISASRWRTIRREAEASAELRLAA